MKIGHDCACRVEMHSCCWIEIFQFNKTDIVALPRTGFLGLFFRQLYSC